VVPGSYIGENSLESTNSAFIFMYVEKARTFPMPWDISAVTVGSKLKVLYLHVRGEKATDPSIAGRILLNSLKEQVRSSCIKEP